MNYDARTLVTLADDECVIDRTMTCQRRDERHIGKARPEFWHCPTDCSRPDATSQR
jgi:hypothetical protein